MDEESLKEKLAGKPFPDIAIELSKAKAKSVSDDNPGYYVIGSDQICTVDDEILSKPGNTENAFKNLKKLSGKTHKQQCGVSIYKDGEHIWSTVDIAELKMRDLTDSEIQEYISADEPFQSCGAYKFESLGGNLFSDVKGSSHTIQGLPLLPLLNALQEYKAY